MYGKRLISAAICCLVTVAHAADLSQEQSQLNNVNADERRSLAEAGELLDRSAEGAAVEQANAVDAEAPAAQDAGLAVNDTDKNRRPCRKAPEATKCSNSDCSNIDSHSHHRYNPSNNRSFQLPINNHHCQHPRCNLHDRLHRNDNCRQHNRRPNPNLHLPNSPNLNLHHNLPIHPRHNPRPNHNRSFHPTHHSNQHPKRRNRNPNRHHIPNCYSDRYRPYEYRNRKRCDDDFTCYDCEGYASTDWNACGSYARRWWRCE
ncbi:hypothetical protein CB0940_06986 [Cercospora beticola]|uniref:Secreted protein n=1 Tax=Cercospora beticola TaxID=122368 RepID=A0A2G5HB32_CERBT|nr:hypothetical protein CB0940_06986 [Cercospora beticola]PIA89462.1 hypothetical protein CB0940_06986 [Cercospora beticola]